MDSNDDDLNAEIIDLMIRLGVKKSDIDMVIENFYTPCEIAEKAFKRAVSLYKKNDTRLFINSIERYLMDNGLTVNVYQIRKRSIFLNRPVDKVTIREYLKR